MAGKKKFQIARRFDKLVKVNVENLFIPDVFKAPKDEETALACMRSYDSGGIDCLCTVIDEYDAIAADIRRKKQPPLKQPSDSTAIERFDSGGVLMQYRKEKGLDKLRADLIDGIARMASFEEGIDLVYAHLMSPKNLEKSDLPIADEAGRIAEEKEKVVNGKMTEIAMFYPDITADEVAWLSLTSGKEEDWVFDRPQRMYWPPSLIEIDLDGLVFAEGTIDDKEFDNINSASPWQIGGLTGIDSQTCSVPFDTNIKQAIKAIILLSLDDSDLYDRLWSEEMLVPITRGDGNLVKIFAGETRDQMLVKEARKEIVRYYNNSYFDCPYADRAIDFVKMIGTLERVPDFVKEKIPFRGYARVHGTAMNFIDESGKILDTVPIAAHLSHNIAYQFHSRISDLDRKDTILREIFDELSRKINEKNIEEGNQMPSDVLQDQILEEGIFLSNQAYSRIEKVPKSAMYMRGHISDESLVRTVKFSFYELLDVKDLLKDIPKKLKAGAIALIKRTADLASLDEVLLHEMEAGSYCPSNKTITLSLPEKTPISKSEIDVLLKQMYSERDLMYKFKITFNQTLAHEIGESVYSLNPGIAEAWDKINSKVAADTAREERAKYFLTSYGTTNSNEDFADTFAMYLMFGSQFRQKCAHPIIKEKYEFMKMLFSIDGKEREFNDRFRYSMYTVSNHPGTDFERKLQLAALREEMEIASSDLNYQRLEAGNTAMSYDDVEDVIREHEEKGIPISREKAARILSENNAEAAEAMEEYQSKRHLDRSVKMKVCLTLYSTSFDISGFLTEYDEFCGYMLDGNRQSAQEMFEKLGMESKTAKKAVKELMPVYKNPYVREVLEELRAGQKENEEEGQPSLCGAKLYEIIKEYSAENPGKTFLNL